MPLTGYMKIPDIDGESQFADHEDEIDIHGIDWGVLRKGTRVRGGRRPTGRPVIRPLVVHKFYDAASPYIALAAMQGKAFDEIVISVRKDSGEAHLDYLTITLTNCTLKAYDMFNDGQDDPLNLISERVGINAEKIKILYTVQADDHSAGDEHEIEYDIVAGV